MTARRVISVLVLLVILWERWRTANRFLKQHGKSIPEPDTLAGLRWRMIDSADQCPEPWRTVLGLLFIRIEKKWIRAEVGRRINDLGVEL